MLILNQTYGKLLDRLIFLICQNIIFYDKDILMVPGQMFKVFQNIIVANFADDLHFDASIFLLARPSGRG